MLVQAVAGGMGERDKWAICPGHNIVFCFHTPPMAVAPHTTSVAPLPLIFRGWVSVGKRNDERVQVAFRVPMASSPILVPPVLCSSQPLFSMGPRMPPLSRLTISFSDVGCVARALGPWLFVNSCAMRMCFKSTCRERPQPAVQLGAKDGARCCTQSGTTCRCCTQGVPTWLTQAAWMWMDGPVYRLWWGHPL